MDATTGSQPVLDPEIRANAQVPLTLRFVSAKRLDNDIDAVSYEQEWLQSRQMVVKAKNILWFFVPKLSRELNYWKRQLAALKTLQAQIFGSGEWDVLALSELFRNPTTLTFLNECALASEIPVQLEFKPGCVKDVYQDRQTREFVVRMLGVVRETEEPVPASVHMYNVVFGFLRAFRVLSNGGELVHALGTSTQLISHGLFLTTRDRLYEILDNGGVPFRVALLEPHAHIYKTRWNEDGDEDYDGGAGQIAQQRIHTTKYIRAHVGYNLINDMTRFSGATNNRILGDGSSILLTIKRDTDNGGVPVVDTHMYIGDRILTFQTRNAIIFRLLSPIGNSGVPYPWALDHVYKHAFLFNTLEHIKMPVENTIGFGAAPKLVPVPKGEIDPYDIVYHRHSGPKLARTRKALNIGAMFGFGGASNEDHSQFFLRPHIQSVVRVDGKEKVETIEDMVDRLEHVVNDPVHVIDPPPHSNTTPRVESKPWIYTLDGNRKYVSKQELIDTIRKLTMAAAMDTGSQPLSNVEIVEERL